jgi:hypothetical protein
MKIIVTPDLETPGIMLLLRAMSVLYAKKDIILWMRNPDTCWVSCPLLRS